MKVLVVDDDFDFRQLAQALIKRSYPRAQVRGYDPAQSGPPAEDFAWADYDLVLLDHELNSEQTGLDWLRRYGDLPGFPAVIFATGAGDENLAARAMKFGADEYLSKRDISAQRLGALMSSVLAERASSVVTHAPHDSAVVDPLSGPASQPVPGYQLRRLLGCGGTADVYLAQRDRDGHTVVLKLLREGMANEEAAIKRLRREARILLSMDSAQIVRVYESGVQLGRAYMVMEYLGHGDLATRINEGMHPAVARDYAQAIASGLVAVHGQQVVHRDLKPANIMFRYDDTLVLTDFGIARQEEVDDSMTESGSVVGTPYYMSPEQCDGHQATPASDLYSLGVVLFEMLTGERPFQGASAQMLLIQHLTAPIPELSPELSVFQPVVDCLLAKEADDRYGSASEAVEVLAAVQLPS